MNNKSIFVLLTVVLLTVNFSDAKGQIVPDSLGTLTLKESINIAQENSPVAQAHRYSLISSKWQYKQFHATLLPSLVLRGNAPNYHRRVTSQTVVVDTTGSTTEFKTIFGSNQQSNANVSLGIQQRFWRTGGTITLSSGISRLGIFEGERTYGWSSHPLRVSISQPIFQFNRLKWRHKIEPLQFTIAQKQFNQNMENLSVRITNAFFDVALAKINKQDAKLNVARNDSIYQLSKGRYKIGKIAKNAMLKAKLKFHQAQEALSKAKINYQRSLNNLKLLLGYPTTVELELNIPKKLPKFTVNIEKAQRLALKNNSQSLSHKLDKIQAKRSLQQAKSQGGFKATLTASYGFNKNANKFSNLFNNLLTSQGFNLSFNMPIFDWGKHEAQIQAARNQMRATINNVQFEQQQFLQSVRYRVVNFMQLRHQQYLQENQKG